MTDFLSQLDAGAKELRVAGRAIPVRDVRVRCRGREPRRVRMRDVRMVRMRPVEMRRVEMAPEFSSMIAIFGSR